MSWLRLSCDALLTRMGLPYTLIIFSTFTACGVRERAHRQWSAL